VPVLTVDLGNTRLKACLWERSGATFACAAHWEDESRELSGFERWLASRRPTLAALASVAAPEATERVRALLAARCERVLLGPESGLENRCREPERVGADRLYAAAGAAAVCGRSCLVVDAGTALTVDAVLVSTGAHAFLGGAIAPGPHLAAAALAAGTARLPRIEPRAGARALGTVTEEAIQAGIVVGFRGAAERLVEELAEEVRFADAPVVLTGGAREFLLVPRPFSARPLEVVPELVQRGLLEALLRVADGARAP
jgi:type III pantothenate kinase